MQFEIKSGTKLVRATSNEHGVWRSRLYVNDGEPATLIAAKCGTERGARMWAQRALAS